MNVTLWLYMLLAFGIGFVVGKYYKTAKKIVDEEKLVPFKSEVVYGNN